MSAKRKSDIVEADEAVSEDSVDEEPAVESGDPVTEESGGGNVAKVRRMVYERKPNGQLVLVEEK